MLSFLVWSTAVVDWQLLFCLVVMVRFSVFVVVVEIFKENI